MNNRLDIEIFTIAQNIKIGLYLAIFYTVPLLVQTKRQLSTNQLVEFVNVVSL